jgi:hypothetical protein
MKIWVQSVIVSVSISSCGLCPMGEPSLFDQSKSSVHLTALHGAVLAKNVDLVLQLLKRRANPNEPDERGDTPMHYAAVMEDGATAIGIIYRLIAWKASVLIRNRQGEYPQDCAVNSTVKVCLDRRAEQELIERNDAMQAESLCFLVRPEAGYCRPVEHWLADVVRGSAEEGRQTEELVY